MNGIRPFLRTFRSTKRYNIGYELEVKKMLKDHTDEKTEEQNNDKKLVNPKAGAEALATFNLGSTRFTW